MDKIAKALARLSREERVQVSVILQKIAVGSLIGLDIKKLKGYADIFRVRKGHIRIIYRVKKGGQIFILTIERRSETTYSGF